ncbi:RNA-binding (RRM/RBD/RNP motifs) family protein [Rhynchospora pubera]|uniref:RNA-binding (RRM/RBD/RNP motifs) family protein n=1 Tax=Rhynchospora pubera TaxID=906938 RepID=A0AAV8G695_9POAL|nr:RNA-binding (RRM/RBD/RNP motifs) family protein [Rhynchospora pubera]
MANKSWERDAASAGKIFIGGLARDTTDSALLKHFRKYGEVIDHIIMINKFTGEPRGFGFVTFSDPSVVEIVMDDTHIINGKQVEIKRTIPKRSGGRHNDYNAKTKKIFVGGIPPSLTEDELGQFFAKYGEVVDQEIIRDHETNRSRGFGFVVFESEEVVDALLSKGSIIELDGIKVEVKRAEPKKSSFSSNSQSGVRTFGEECGNFEASYGAGFGNPSAFGATAYKNSGNRFGGYNGYSAFDGSLGAYTGYGFYGGYGSFLGGYGQVDASFGGGYDFSLGGGYDFSMAGGFGTGAVNGMRGGYGGSSGSSSGSNGRYHPYRR